MHYEDKKTGFKFDAVSGVPKENTVEAFEELFSANKAAEEGELPALPEPKLLREGLIVGTYGYQASDMTAYARQSIAADRASRQVANKAEVEPIAHLKFWASQSWSGNGNHDIENGEGLEVCQPGEIGDDGRPAFPVFATPPATTGASTAKTGEQ